MRKRYFIEKINRSLFRNDKAYLDDYRQILTSYNKNDIKLLHLGGGRDKRNIGKVFKESGFFVLDTDLNGLLLNKNKNLICGRAESAPLKDNSFDLVTLEDVFEHIEYPHLLLDEMRRVLKPGSEIVFVTPNANSYISLLARLTPFCFHKFYNKLRGVSTDDIFPTYYRFNTSRVIRRISRERGFELVLFKSYIGCPEYFGFSAILHLTASIFHKLASLVPFIEKEVCLNFLVILRLYAKRQGEIL